MYRKDLTDSDGMLFIWKNEDKRCMWMKNTYIPLDIIFLYEKKRIIGYVIDAEPLSEKSLSIDKPLVIPILLLMVSK